MESQATTFYVTDIFYLQQYQIQALQQKLALATAEIESLKQTIVAQKAFPPAKPMNVSFWNEEEHKRFLEGIERFGVKNFKKIAEHVGTRTRLQIRSHAQKYFMKLKRQNRSKPEEALLQQWETRPQTPRQNDAEELESLFPAYQTSSSPLSTEEH